MANNQISKQKIEELMKKPGKFIGGTLQMTSRYIKTTKGEEGLKRLEAEMKNLGHPINFNKVKTLDWYPIGLRALTLIALKRAFNWGNKELVEFGKSMLVFNPLIKLAARYLISTEKLFKTVSTHWSKNHTQGWLEPYKFDKKEKYAIVRLHDFKIHPNFCFLFLGYFKSMAQFSGRRNVTIKETKCMFKGDPYHEYLIRWK
jgi:hypothetical protein